MSATNAIDTSAAMDCAIDGKHVLVLGLGESGLSMAQWLARHGAQVRVADTRTAPPGLAELRATVEEAELRFGAFDECVLEGIDWVALSPGLSPAEPIVRAARARGMTVCGDIELFARALTRVQARPRIVAITGTNGKTTVTALVGAMCRAAGREAEVAGNISPAALAALMACEDAGRVPEIWVLELSSFQLETTDSLAADAAVVLNISEDHLDRHGTLAAYAAAKARVYAGGGVRVINREDVLCRAMAQPGRRMISFGLDAPPRDEDFGLLDVAGELHLAQGTTPLLPLRAMRLEGMHNAANALAALALARAIDLPLPPLVEALRSFAGLPHRVERVSEYRGVVFYDDSKGTNVGATVAALRGFTRQLDGHGKVVLIAGGQGKGQDFHPLRAVINAGARAVVLIGCDAPMIRDVLDDAAVPLTDAQDMDDAVRCAYAAAQAGDVVLLSPACASLDMYRNYKHRGDVFRAAVERLRR